MLGNRCDVTGLLRRLQVNIQVFIMTTSLKTDFAQIFSRCLKTLSCPKFGGLQPPSPPGPYAYVFTVLLKRNNTDKGPGNKKSCNIHSRSSLDLVE